MLYGYVIRNVLVTADTRIGGVALGCAGRRGYGRRMHMLTGSFHYAVQIRIGAAASITGIAVEPVGETAGLDGRFHVLVP